MKIFFHTFGCRVNQYETELIREKLLANGAQKTVSGRFISDPTGVRKEGNVSEGSSRQVEAYEDADVCIINTCTVTREADKDALRLIRRISKRNPTARLVVTGCYATRDPKEILDAAPNAMVVGNEQKEALPAMLGCTPAADFTGISDFYNHSRAFVKVQDGCNMHCTYCIIPSVRPELSCKPYPDLEREVRGLIEAGTQEIVLCGVRLGRYLVNDASGRRVDFTAMLDRLLSLPGDFRIRLSSFEVTDLTDRFLDLFARWDGKICPSFHVPLQSGSEAVLKRMQRWYTAGFYARRISALKSRKRDVGLFADVMVGFPGETRAHFKESLDFTSRMGYSGLHVFRYSHRPGTPAARYKDQVPGEAIVERAQAMRDLDQKLRTAFAAHSVGSVRRVLAEKPQKMRVPPFGDAPVEGVTDHFLRVRFEEVPGPGLVWARIAASNGPLAMASVAAAGQRA